jgi:acyl-coenzyme A thioesterase PaaI-like protein
VSGPLQVAGGPEALFRLDPLTVNGTTLRSSMAAGPWLLSQDGRPSLGAVGVLVDVVLGHAIHATRPAGHWSVSTEITVEACEGLRSAASRLSAEGAVVHIDSVGGLAGGRVVDDAGRLVAVCRQRGRFVEVDSATLPAPEPWPAPDETATTAELLGLPEPVQDSLSLPVAGHLTNPMGNLHGGVTLCISDLLAEAALLRSPGPPLTTASIHVIYTRPLPAGCSGLFTAKVRHRSRRLGVVEVEGSVDGRMATRATVVAHPARV